MSAKHYQVLIIYVYTAYISLAFNEYSILTLFHAINDPLIQMTYTSIGKTESQSEIVFKGQLGSVL